MSATGTVVGTGGGRYRIELDEGGEAEAALRGRLKTEARTGDRVVIGDRVRVAPEDELFTIEEVLPRETEIARRVAGGRKAKVVAANVDRVLVVVAAADPPPRERQIDRLLVVGESAGADVLLVVNKVDLGEAGATDGLVGLYRDVGYTVLPTSARTGEGIEVLREVLGSGVSALIGPSGAGKSSLLNALSPGLRLRTGELGQRSRQGRHTTVSARLLALPDGGKVADTPGFGDVGVWGVEATDLDRCFPEFRPLLDGCRFRGCSHLHEPDCAVREAVERGEIAPGRYESYAVLMEEASAGD